jgi:membrane protein required for colicin V production
LIKCSKKGFILSILSASKWLFAYVLTLFLFPRIKPYVENIIDNEYILDVGLGIIIFIFVIFIVLSINKAIGSAIRYSGLGTFDKIFGFFFGFFRGYIISVCLFATINIVYNYDKWPMNLDESLSFPFVKKGSNYLIERFPDEENYKDTKEKIEKI